MGIVFQAEWIIPDSRPSDDWPGEGSIEVEEFDLKYREGLPLVLKQINCDIKPGEKVRCQPPQYLQSISPQGTHANCMTVSGYRKVRILAKYRKILIISPSKTKPSGK